MKYIQTATETSDLRGLSDVLNPDSQFNKLGAMFWRTSPSGSRYNFYDVIALTVDLAHYVGFPYASRPHSWSGRVHDALLKSSQYSTQTFVHFLVGHHHSQSNPASSDEFVAAVELLEADIPFDDDCLNEYMNAPNRRQSLEASELRAKELVGGAVLGEETDLFEMIGMLIALGRRIPSITTLRKILGSARIVNRSEGVYFRPFSFLVQLVKPFYDVASKGLLERYAQEIRDVSTLNGLVRTMKNFTGNKEARRAIQKYLNELDTIPDENRLKKEEYEKQLKYALKILEKILEALNSWIKGKGSAMISLGEDMIDKIKEKGWHAEETEAFNSWLMDKVVTRRMNATSIIYHTKDESWQATKEVDHYLKGLLVAYARWKVRERSASFYEEIIQFDKDNAGQQETYEVLDSLIEFYDQDVRGGWKHWYLSYPGLPPLPPSLETIHNKLNTMKQEKLENTGVVADVTLSPDISKLGAFYGYMSENCLAAESCAIHSISDPDFVPYRMVVDGEWRGVVQTFTKNVMIGGKKKKILIVTGVDPQRNLTPSPEEFLNGLEKGFWEIAREGGYDLVVVPALDFAQSSRRALLRMAFKRYTEKIRIDEPVGFPQVGVNPDGSPLYYGDERHGGEAQHQEFLVFRGPPSSS